MSSGAFWHLLPCPALPKLASSSPAGLHLVPQHHFLPLHTFSSLKSFPLKYLLFVYLQAPHSLRSLTRPIPHPSRQPLPFGDCQWQTLDNLFFPIEPWGISLTLASVTLARRRVSAGVCWTRVLHSVFWVLVRFRVWWEVDKDFPACPMSVSRRWFNVRVERGQSK